MFVARFNLTVLPCHSPPAIEIKVIRNDGTVLIDDTLVRSRLENITVGATVITRLDITVRHSFNDIIVKVCFTQTTISKIIVVIVQFLNM